MKNVTLILLAILLIGCNRSPREDDIYENVLTNERIKIHQVGLCSEIERNLERSNELFKEDGVPVRIAIVRLFFNAEDRCYTYLQSTQYLSVLSAPIYPVSRLDSPEWRKVR
jgi:hypothetical protein